MRGKLEISTEREQAEVKKMGQYRLIKFLAKYGLVVKVAAYGVCEPGFDSSSLKLFGMSTFR